MHLQNTQKEALGVTVSAVSMFGLIIIMVIKDMVQQLLENIDHLVVNTRAGVKAKASATKHNCWVNRAYYNIY